jgi:hypothetical protein
MTAALFVLAAVGAKAFYLLLVWLASAIAASELSKRKGYGEKWGLGTGLLLSVIGVIVWAVVPPRPDSPWRQRQQRERAAKT